MILMHLKELRSRKGVTQQDVADILKVTRASYTNIENGKRETDFSSLIKLADYFEVSTDYLLGKVDTPTTSQSKLDSPSKGMVAITLNPYGGKQTTKYVPIEAMKELENYADLLIKKAEENNKN